MAHLAFSDIHGRYDLLRQILDSTKPGDKLYFLGDAADRGPDPWKCISALMSDSRIVWIKGNHDEFLQKLYLINDLGASAGGGNMWLYNGGEKTIEECILNLRTEQNIQNFCTYIRKLPERIDLVNAEGKNLVLTHAGLDPELSDEEYYAWHGQNERRYLWDRHHLHSPWRGGDNTWIIHGHTPIPYITNMNSKEEENYFKNPQIKIYADGHKIDLDTGAVWTNTTALFNLDTFEVKYFTIKEPENERY